MKSEDLQYGIVSNILKKMLQKKSTLKKNYKALRILGIIKAIYKATTLLQTKSKKYMKNDRRHKNKKEMLVLQRR